MNFHFTTIQVIWTITFAALLTLLVVLLGRDRARRFPWFTASICVVALSLLTSRLLFRRLDQIHLATVSIILADISALLTLLVLMEIARRHVFRSVSRRAWMFGSLALLAAGCTVVATWGEWPNPKSLAPTSLLATLGLLQLLAQKMGLMNDVLTIGLALLVVFFGRRFGFGWRSHAQQIIVGLATVALSQIAIQIIWQVIAMHTKVNSFADYNRLNDIKAKLLNGNSTVYAAVLIWWILCLWFDEPGNAAPAIEAVPEPTEPAA
ncbi:MAG TPA: hypothetical protein VG893_03250 [Terracidiphilus sp.]|nr:hypothetical protein [Terracidiphilus sp.]